MTGGQDQRVTHPAPHDRSDLDALPLERKALLLSGRDFWSTEPVEEAGLPSVLLTDGPHGVRRQKGASDQIGFLDSLPATCFPPAVAVGSSWDPDLAERIGAAVGREARALGVHVVLGPGVNIKRSPLCGRNFEYYSEDPLLTGVLAAAHVRGQQGEGVGASVKHFAANNQETQRMQVSVDVDERTLREIYLPAFERIVTETQPATIMSAYNRINGVYASENRWLLTDVLRDEWGFAGVVVSDWGAVDDRVAALEAGLDLQMPGDRGAGNRIVVDAVKAGALDEALVDRSARRVAALAELVTEPTDGFDADAHHALARELAAGCAVLLKNDRDALPLAPGSRVAVVGEFARDAALPGRRQLARARHPGGRRAERAAGPPHRDGSLRRRVHPRRHGRRPRPCARRRSTSRGTPTSRSSSPGWPTATSPRASTGPRSTCPRRRWS